MQEKRYKYNFKEFMGGNLLCWKHRQELPSLTERTTVTGHTTWPQPLVFPEPFSFKDRSQAPWEKSASRPGTQSTGHSEHGAEARRPTRPTAPSAETGGSEERGTSRNAARFTRLTTHGDESQTQPRLQGDTHVKTHLVCQVPRAPQTGR